MEFRICPVLSDILSSRCKPNFISWRPLCRIPNTGLESLQHQVGGLIQALYPFEYAAIICNDEGKLLGLPWNRPLFDEDGNIYDVIAGTFLVVGLTEDDFGSLTEEQVKRYTDLFRLHF